MLRLAVFSDDFPLRGSRCVGIVFLKVRRRVPESSLLRSRCVGDRSKLFSMCRETGSGGQMPREIESLSR